MFSMVYLLFSVSFPAGSGVQGFDANVGTKGDSLNCTLVGGWFSGFDYTVFVKDTIAYIGDGVCLRILNVKDPSNPVVLGMVKVPSFVRGIYVSDTLAYVGDWGDGLRIINVKDPTNPSEVGYYDTGWYAWDVYVVDTLAYVADDGDGLRIINVKDPENPTEMGYYITGDYALGVYVVDTLAYVADGNNGLRIINVKDPTNPTEVGYYDTGSYAYGVYVIDTLAYVADGYDGLYIIKFAGSSTGIKKKEPDLSMNMLGNGFKMSFYLERSERVSIKVFDIGGRYVSTPVDRVLSSGYHTFRWKGRPGVYFVRVEIGGKKMMERVVIVK